MTIRPGVDLGAAFERLKIAFNRAKEAPEFSAAHAILYVHTEDFIKQFDDEKQEAQQPPTLLLHDALNWSEDDIPDELFSKPNIHP